MHNLHTLSVYVLVQTRRTFCVLNPDCCAFSNFTVYPCTGLPWPTAKDTCRALGSEGMPNVWVIRGFNIKEISNYLTRIKQCDEFLVEKGLNSLTPSELEDACHDRCIPITNKNNRQLTSDLDLWLRLTTTSGAGLADDDYVDSNKYSGSGRLGRIVNPYNRRLALMGLFVHREFQTSNFASSYRALLAPSQ
jgi:LETM1-like protein